MPLLIPLIFLHEVKIITPNDDGSVHLSTVASTSKDTTPDGNSASEWTLLIDVSPFNCLSGSLESQAYALPESIPSLSWPLSFSCLLRAEKHLGLLQKRLLGLLRHGWISGLSC